MPNAAPVLDAPAPTSRPAPAPVPAAHPAIAPAARLRAFLAATASLVMIFVASSSPVPIYNVYRAQNGITNADLSLSVVAYFAGTILALVSLGRLTNHLGRKPVSLGTLVIMAAGCLVLIHVDGLAPLALGRFIMGVGAGLASSSLTSYVVDAAPTSPGWLASVASSQSSQVGLTLGSLVSGVIVQTVADARTVSYAVMIALLAACALALLTVPETGTRSPGALASLRPRVGVPVSVRPRLLTAGTAFVVTWAVGGFYQSFIPAITAEQLGSTNAVVVALVFSAYMLSGAFGAPLAGLFEASRAQRIGITVWLAGLWAVLASLVAGQLSKVLDIVPIAMGYGVMGVVGALVVWTRAVSIEGR